MRVQARLALEVAPGSGAALEVAAGERLRVALPDGAQVCDLIAFCLEDPQERFGSSVTRQREGAHPRVGTTLWSAPPWERPLLRLVADTVAHQRTARGAESHDLLFGRCSEAWRRLYYGSATPGCQENLAAAIAPHGLAPTDVHDPLNLFMRTGLGADGRLFFEDPDARAGDYVDLLAERPCLVAVSACPGRSSGPVQHRLLLEVYADSAPNAARDERSSG